MKSGILLVLCLSTIFAQGIDLSSDFEAQNFNQRQPEMNYESTSSENFEQIQATPIKSQDSIQQYQMDEVVTEYTTSPMEYQEEVIQKDPIDSQVEEVIYETKVETYHPKVVTLDPSQYEYTDYSDEELLPQKSQQQDVQVIPDEPSQDQTISSENQVPIEAQSINQIVDENKPVQESANHFNQVPIFLQQSSFETSQVSNNANSIIDDFANPSNIPISSTVSMRDYSTENSVSQSPIINNNEVIDPTFAPQQETNLPADNTDIFAVSPQPDATSNQIIEPSFIPSEDIQKVDTSINAQVDNTVSAASSEPIDPFFIPNENIESSNSVPVENADSLFAPSNQQVDNSLIPTEQSQNIDSQMNTSVENTDPSFLPQQTTQESIVPVENQEPNIATSNQSVDPAFIPNEQNQVVSSSMETSVENTDPSFSTPNQSVDPAFIPSGEINPTESINPIENMDVSQQPLDSQMNEGTQQVNSSIDTPVENSDPSFTSSNQPVDSAMIPSDEVHNIDTPMNAPVDPTFEVQNQPIDSVSIPSEETQNIDTSMNTSVENNESIQADQSYIPNEEISNADTYFNAPVENTDPSFSTSNQTENPPQISNDQMQYADQTFSAANQPVDSTFIPNEKMEDIETPMNAPFENPDPAFVPNNQNIVDSVSSVEPSYIPMEDDKISDSAPMTFENNNNPKDEFNLISNEEVQQQEQRNILMDEPIENNEIPTKIQNEVEDNISTQEVESNNDSTQEVAFQPVEQMSIPQEQLPQSNLDVLKAEEQQSIMDNSMPDEPIENSSIPDSPQIQQQTLLAPTSKGIQEDNNEDITSSQMRAPIIPIQNQGLESEPLENYTTAPLEMSNQQMDNWSQTAGSIDNKIKDNEIEPQNIEKIASSQNYQNQFFFFQ